MRKYLLALLVATAAFAEEAKVEIVSTSDTSLTYRERVAERVYVDEAAQAFHYDGCPRITKAMPQLAPAAATLRGYKAHCPALRKTAYATRTVTRKPHDPKVISVLYLGNSLTYYNEIPRMTQAIGAREPKPLRIDSVTRSGVSLPQLWNETDALSRLWSEHWDYVVIQGGGGGIGPIRNPALFNDYLARFAAAVRKSGAQPLFYMIWRIENPGEHNTASLASAKQLNLPIVPVGLAWTDLTSRGRFKRLDWDGVHPDAFGAYLIACTVYSTIYNKPAHGAPYRFKQFAVSSEVYDDALREQNPNAEDARAIQDAAWSAIQRVKKP
jgi:lysophospholipase L1-like esterase